MIVAGVEGMPRAGEKYFKPGGKIHRGRVQGHADVAQVACGIAGGNAQAPAQRYRQMGKIAAYSLPAQPYVKRRLAGMGEVISKFNILMHIRANRLHALVAGGTIAETLPGKFHQSIGFAVTRGL